MYKMGDHLLANSENIEVSFYEPGQCANNLIARYDKNSLKLNLETYRQTPVEQAHERYRFHPNRAAIFSNSPDFGLMKMVSPELEKFISNNTGLTPKGNVGSLNSPELSLFNLVSPEFEKVLASVQKTPTPTRNLRECNSVSQQREAYVQGFVEALQHIHNRQPQPGEIDSGKQELLSVSQPAPLTHSHSHESNWTRQVQAPNQTHYQIPLADNIYEMKSNTYGSESLDHQPELNQLVLNQTHEQHDFKVEEHQESQHIQTHSSSHFLPMPPIDLEVQEIVKRERKKQKNRVAASKCRKKKLEREAQLEVRVQQLKEKNIELGAVANALRQQVGELKQRVLEHVAFGCQLPEITTAAY